jgi:hypothetical protein
MDSEAVSRRSFRHELHWTKRSLGTDCIDSISRFSETDRTQDASVNPVTNRRFNNRRPDFSCLLLQRSLDIGRAWAIAPALTKEAVKSWIPICFHHEAAPSNRWAK